MKIITKQLFIAILFYKKGGNNNKSILHSTIAFSIPSLTWGAIWTYRNQTSICHCHILGVGSCRNTIRWRMGTFFSSSDINIWIFYFRTGFFIIKNMFCCGGPRWRCMGIFSPIFIINFWIFMFKSIIFIFFIIIVSIFRWVCRSCRMILWILVRRRMMRLRTTVFFILWKKKMLLYE